MATWFLYLTTVFIWGTTWIAIKNQIGDVPAEASIFYRSFLASLLLLGYCKIKKISLKFSLKNHGLLFLLGACMFSLHYIFIYKSTSYLISGLVSLIFSLVSLLNILNNYIVFKVRPTRWVIYGAIFGLCGIFLIFYKDLLNASFQDKILVGSILAFGGTVIFSIGNIISRLGYIRGLPLIPTTTLGICYGTLIMFIFILITKVPFRVSYDPIYWIALGYLVIFGSIVGFLCYLSLIGKIGPEKAGYATIFFPIVALIFSFLFENYHWTQNGLLGVGMVIFGNYLVMKKK